MHSITRGHLLRHAPHGGSADATVALLDVAQDFLLHHLAASEIFDVVTFKGGTAIRKLFAGQKGRFSTYLDFAMFDPVPNRDLDETRQAVAQLIVEAAKNTPGPFEFDAEVRRGRWHLSVSSEFGSPEQSIKVDVGPAPWLQPEMRAFVPAPIHNEYGLDLPSLPTVQMLETLAEKISRLNRPYVSTARDAFDLVWAMKTPPFSSDLDRSLMRRLAVLKIWGDANGLGGAKTIVAVDGFDPSLWLRVREDWDDEAIGLLTTPPPSLDELGEEMRTRMEWLSDLSVEEARWAVCDPRDREQVIAAIVSLPTARLQPADLRGHG